MSSASLSVNPHTYCVGRPFLLWPSTAPTSSPIVPGSPDSFTPNHLNYAYSHLSALVFAHTVLSALNTISSVSSHFGALHKIIFPLRIIQCSFLCEQLFLLKADLHSFPWPLEDRDYTPLDPSTPSTLCVQKAFVNEWVDWQEYLPFLGSEPWWSAYNLSSTLQI